MSPRARRTGDSPRAARFQILVAKNVDAAVRDARTPRRVKEAFVHVHRDTAQRGCAAAHYRLSGPGDWPRFCVVQLPEGWRLVMSFPEMDTVAFLVLDKHDNNTDPYAFLEKSFGLPDRSGHGAGRAQPKPACCNDMSAPPLAEEADLMAAIDQIVRHRR
ncbi:hypothetical protein AB0O34_00040 [Sphaerisporangium sp. NPDC088356]|uniref:hypothetical protein n=1 Tax=Sphaerisporangium sp. NPDC088356 TaxID=3154871 RepID=UPI0034355B8A